MEELIALLKSKCGAGKLACPYNWTRRTESIEIEQRWGQVDDLMKGLSYGIDFQEWSYALFYELEAAKRKIAALISSGDSEFALPHRTYFTSNPNTTDRRITAFLGSEMRVQAILPINNLEKITLRKSRETYGPIVAAAMKADRERQEKMPRADFVDYLVNQMHLAQKDPQTILCKSFVDLYAEVDRLITLRTDLRSVWFYLPLLWTSMLFKDKLLSQASRVPKASDYYDVECNSLALLTCRYMIIDKEMANLTKQLKFDELFGCQVFPSTADGIVALTNAIASV